MKSFLHIKAKKIETIISYFDNHLWNVGIQKIFYSPKSRKDLDRIYDYIYDDLNNPIAAEKTVKGILNKIGEIKEYPRLGPVWYLENNIDSGFRFLTCDNYIIFYQITKETIFIVRILHRLQDYVKQLF